MPIRSKGVHHMALVTNDMDKTVKFWTEVLNCPIIVTLHLPPVDPFPGLTWGDLGDKKHYFFDIGNGDSVAFFDLGEENPTVKEAGFGHHLALKLDTEEQLLDTKAQLEAHGVKVSEVVDHMFCRSIYFRDHNGIYLEYAVYVEQCRPDTPFLQDADPVPAALKHLGNKQEANLRHFEAGNVETYDGGDTIKA